MSETIDTEAVMTVANTERQHVTLFGSSEPDAVIERATSVANALKSVILKQGLVSTISGKQYPRCEAWTLLGTMLGIFPVCQWTKQVEGGWEARVEARTRDGAVVGSAEAQCLRAERNWANRDDFALRSMAQTRATAKALRMPLGFVMTLSGFEPTPAEEMVADHPKNVREEYLPLPEAAKTVDKPKSPAKCATAITRQWWIEQFNATPGRDGRPTLTEFCRRAGMLLPTEELEDVPLRFVPANKGQLDTFAAAVDKFVEEPGPCEPPFVNDVAIEPEEVKRRLGTDKAPPKQALPPQGKWQDQVIHFGKNAGKHLGILEPNQLKWYCEHFHPEPTFMGSDGQPHNKKPESMAKDNALRAALDAAMAELGVHP